MIDLYRMETKNQTCINFYLYYHQTYKNHFMVYPVSIFKINMMWLNFIFYNIEWIITYEITFFQWLQIYKQSVV